MIILQAALLIFTGIVCVCGSELSVEDYLREHPELSPLTDKHEPQTLWDRSLMPVPRDLTYPVENHLFGERKQGKRPKTRERRQIEGCYLLFANRVHVVKMQNSLQISLALTGLSNAIAVDFDKRDGYLFWSDVDLHRIYRSRVDGSEATVLIDKNITTPDGIAWDWVSKKLYWTDADDHDLEVYDPSSGQRKVLFQNGAGSRPRAIVLDPSTRCMYWTDWGIPATIERASMDGSGHTVLHNTSLWWPNAFTIDYDSQTLYWMDAKLDKLESSSVDGSRRTLLSTLHIYHPFSLTFYEGQLFWSDWELKAILGVSLSNLTAVNIIFGNLILDPMGVTSACAARQEAISNTCNGRCGDMMCLLSKSRLHAGHSCLCAEKCSISPAKDEVQPVCEQPCGENGVCAGHNYCRCNDGWRGVLCDEGICNNICMHGECIAPDVCACDGGWEGESCNQAVCCSECGQGTCTYPGWCSCQDGWGGAQCDQEICLVSGGCKNGGSCKGSYCDCMIGYGGPTCEKDCGAVC